MHEANMLLKDRAKNILHLQRKKKQNKMGNTHSNENLKQQTYAQT